MAQADATYSTATAGSHAQTEAHQMLETFWQRAMDEIRNMGPNDFKNQELPLARIKKIMKLDDEVKMISAEAPVLFAKAAEIFITELSLRAWIHTEDNKRRTLQRNDIAMAITKYDQFDFLIDIVPRDELKPTKRQDENIRTTTMHPDQVQYYFQLAQQHQAALQQQTTNVTSGSNQQAQNQLQTTPQIQIVQSGTGIQAVATTPMTVQTASPTFSGPSIVQVQTVASDTSQQQTSGQGQATPSQVQVQVQPTVQAATASQVLQLQQPVQAGQVQQAGGIQIVQQVINSNGEIQQIPIQLTPNQLQLIRMQMQGQNQGQPIILQAAPLSQAAASAVQQTATQTVYQIQQVPQAPGQVTATTATPVFLTPAAGNTTAAVQIQAATIAQQEHQATTTVDDDQQQS
ncbi:nuclear transcription factor Y subunit gamma [Centruroides vittatus]|uniref:nuclear transcription factor Y subunit gamma n=1 Tax=Centruroides vittatus TaxID=120091 RepID=UPI00350EDC8E